jgi:hypothetical protein
LSARIRVWRRTSAPGCWPVSRKLAADHRPGPVEHWAVSERFQGIQRAGLFVINVRDPAERPADEQLLVDLARLRMDDALFKDILGGHGNRLPITAVVANMVDAGDAGRKKWSHRRLSFAVRQEFRR